MHDVQESETDRDFSAFLGANVPSSMHERVRAAASRADRSVSSWMREAIRQQLDEEKPDYADPRELGKVFGVLLADGDEHAAETLALRAATGAVLETEEEDLDRARRTAEALVEVMKEHPDLVDVDGADVAGLTDRELFELALRAAAEPEEEHALRLAELDEGVGD